MAKHTMEELKIKQSLPLEIKIKMSKARIKAWIDYYGEDGVYISFSGGKDSTVLLNLVREDYPNIRAMFVDTGLEYPEIREFVKTFDNVDILKPKLTFKQVIEKYGYPFISKEVSGTIDQINRFFIKIEKEKNINITDKVKFLNDCYNNDINLGYTNGLPVRALQLIGKLPHKKRGSYTGEFSQMYNKSKYNFFLNAPFKISNLCCKVMKKSPAHTYDKVTGRVPITGQMAEESSQRQSIWLKQGCNAFNNTHPISNPLSFWTEQDILRYIKEYNIKICSVYGDVVVDYEDGEQFNGQMDFSDLGLIEDTRKYKTTGCSRTGCMFCGYGCHLEKESRFEKMKITHPKTYDYIMRPKEQGGLNYKEVIDWINNNSDLNIKY